MRKIIFAATLGMLVSLPTYGAANITPPIGLKWGMNKEEVLKHVDSVSLLEEKGDRLREFYLRNPRIKIDGIDGYSVSIDDKYGLVAVDMIQTFSADKHGSEIKNKYDDFKKALSGKFGSPELDEYIKNSNIEFYRCIASRLCGNMSALFDGENGRVYLSINSTGDSRGNIYIGYKDNKLDEIMSEIKKERVDKIKDSL